MRDALRNDGAVLIEDCLDDEQLAACRRRSTGPSPTPDRTRSRSSTAPSTRPTTTTPTRWPSAARRAGAVAAVRRAVRRPLGLRARLVLRRGGVPQGGRQARSRPLAPGHFVPAVGRQALGQHVDQLRAVPKHNALEIVRGSHHGTLYDGTTFRDPNDPTEPLWGGALPRLPDIEAERTSTPTRTTFSRGRRSPATWSSSIPARCTAARPSTPTSPSGTRSSSVSSATTPPSVPCPTTATVTTPERHPLRRRDGQAPARRSVPLPAFKQLV